jgi:hypothetical protein
LIYVAGNAGANGTSLGHKLAPLVPKQMHVASLPTLTFLRMRTMIIVLPVVEMEIFSAAMAVRDHSISDVSILLFSKAISLTSGFATSV